MRKRMYAVLAAMGVLFAGFGARLFWLSGSTLQTVSIQQSSRTQTLGVSRGTIYDRYFQPLVNESSQIVASIAPFESCLSVIRENVSSEAALAVMEQMNEGTRVTLELDSWLPPTYGIAQVALPMRYSEDPLACHVIGYVDGQNNGVTGIEKGYNDVLASYSGEASVSFSVNALEQISYEGKETVSDTLSKSLGGVMLTLDKQIQSIVQTEASRYLERGAVVVTAADSGEVLASVSLPSYDPNAVAEALEDEGAPLLDRTLISYNLGSVFKVITAAAALENGISPQRSYVCTGKYDVGGVQIHCHNRLGDGVLTMSEALACSCNSYFIQLALDVGGEALLKIAHRAGFDEAFSLAAGCKTARAILPAADTLTVPAALANTSIGQGDVMASVYHINALYQAVANGGVWYTPRLYIGEVDENGRLIEADDRDRQTGFLFSKDTADILQTMLKLAVSEGTGQTAAPSVGTAAGKTGTAQTGWEIEGELVEQSWFSGYYPAEAPRYVITVISENGGVDDKRAAPLFAMICDKLYGAGLVENVQEGY